MTVESMTIDRDALELTVVTRFDAPVERVWQLWADPRQLERWWGPPTWPARFSEHELVEGGTMRYVMTGPEGDEAAGWWRVADADAPVALSFEDGFLTAEGEEDPSLPTTLTNVTIDQHGEHTRMTLVSSYRSAADLDALIGMGMEEGLRSALEQIDGLLSD